MKELLHPEEMKIMGSGTDNRGCAWVLYQHIPTGEHYFSDDTLTLAHVDNCDPDEFLSFQANENADDEIPNFVIRETTDDDLQAAGIELVQC